MLHACEIYICARPGAYYELVFDNDIVFVVKSNFVGECFAPEPLYTHTVGKKKSAKFTVQ